MGALTLKNFPFKLRGWDIEKFETIDSTDGFGTQTQVYISNNQIIQIEPSYESIYDTNWITDKSRQFFDSIFKMKSTNNDIKNLNLETENWENFTFKFLKISFLQNHCYKQSNKKYFFNIIFSNVSIEILSLLSVISNKYSFINIKKADNYNIVNDLETTYQLNNFTKKKKLANSSLCLFLTTNTRYEGALLNLILRQRFLKGNFKFITLGPILNSTFFNTFLGSNLKILKTVLEGNHLICQNLKFSKNPIFILSNDLTKRYDSNLKILCTYLNNTTFLKNNWNGLNVLATSIYDTGNASIKKFCTTNSEDLNFFSFICFLNVPKSVNFNFEKITKLKLINYLPKKKNIKIKKLLISQSFLTNQNLISKTKKYKFYDYLHLPTSTFYENEEILMTTEGFIKKTNKLISKKRTKNNWQILRKILNQLNNISFLLKKENQTLFFNIQKLNHFRNFIFFQYQATKSLTNINFYLKLNSKSFILKNKNFKFNNNNQKITLTKLKYWLDDFFCGGKDEYSSNSTILTNCSKISRMENTNFF